MGFKQKYEENDKNYSDKYQLSKVFFGEPSIIIDGSENEIENSFAEELKLVETVDTSTLSDLEGKYKRVANYGCDITLANLKNNIISADGPLFTQCEDTLGSYIQGIY
jgi:hypothetical protein